MDSTAADTSAPRPSLLGRIASAPRPYLYGSLAGMGAYLLLMGLTLGNRPEQFLLCALMFLLAVWSEGTRRFFAGMLPFLLFGIIYDLTHLTEPLVRYLHVHVAEPYRFDKLFFGIPVDGARLTPNELFDRFHWPAVDLVTGSAYILYLYWSLGFAAFLLLAKRKDDRIQRLARRFGWTFLFVNLAGFATYYVYPSAPPWYVTQYGLGPANMAAQASAAAAARWDALTGFGYFAAFYGRSADVFGAIPSLHVSYPLFVFLYGRHLGKRWLDWTSLLFFLLVCFSAVYLQHHYVLDVLLGIAYTLVGVGLERALAAAGERRGAAAPTGEPPLAARSE
ncbi:MAG TPA: phosphatase PAP2 family protein [Anaeromyxobacteraceae bacterium]|jgi:hypothetical protein|nr:phosphatase PAP2 family protein [Anaeromyxobacteraceae bacterium]